MHSYWPGWIETCMTRVVSNEIQCAYVYLRGTFVTLPNNMTSYRLLRSMFLWGLSLPN